MDWVPTDEQTKRVTLCVALGSGNQPWGREKEALAGLGHLASLKVKETYPVHPLPFISFFSFLKKLLENVRSEASVVFVSSLGVWLGIPRTSPFLTRPTQVCPSWTSARYIMLEAGERRAKDREPAMWLASDPGLVLPSSCLLWLRSHAGQGLYSLERILQPVNSTLLPQG